MHAMPWQRLYDALRAREAIGVCRDGPGLNARGERVLHYLRQRERRRREAEEHEQLDEVMQ